MPAPRDHTLADYVVSVLIPVLIMALVGSLVFFLVELLYVGQYQGTLLYILFFFIFGAVLVSRMTLLYNLAHRAGLYGLVLGLCTWLALQRYVTYPQDSLGASWGWALNLGFLALIWWCAHRLTWDCTAGEDDPDPGGPGVLEAARLSPAPASVAASPESTHADQPVEGTPKDRSSLRKKRPRPEPALIAWWRRYQAHREEQRRRPRTLGVWVVYFSIVALLLFGLGQLALSPEDQTRRRYVFGLLVVYLASGLGLLLATCFLTVRRRLRQRQVRMPAPLTALWLGCGAVFILLFLLLAGGLPRPAATSAFWRLSPLATSQDLPASRWAPPRKETGRGEGRPGPAEASGAMAASSNTSQGQRRDSPETTPEKHTAESAAATDPANPHAHNKASKGAAALPSRQTTTESEPQGKAGARPASSQAQQSSGQGRGNGASQKGLSGHATEQPASSSQTAAPAERTKEEGKSAKDSSAEADRQRREPGQRPGSGPRTGSAGAPRNPPPPPDAGRRPAPAPSLPGFSWLLSLGPFVKKLLLILLALGVLALLFRAALGFLANFTGWAQRLLAWLHALGALFQRRRTDTAADAEPGDGLPALPRTFEDFTDPFLTGQAEQMSPAELVRYSFAALEAWAEHCHLGRRAEETPLEFVERLAGEAPALETAARNLVVLYTALAYARRTLRDDCRPLLRQFWQTLRAVAECPLSAGPLVS
jgi:hypothetical protein